MFSISRAAQMVGVTRSTLLYYERIGIISPERDTKNGYRFYTQDDIQALILIRQLQKAGFSLKEADAVMRGRLDPDLVLSRYHDLEQEIQELMAARDVLKSLAIHATGKDPDTVVRVNPAGYWHAELEKRAGDAHGKWLRRLGFDDKEQFYIRWVTRNLTNSKQYMKDFFSVFEQMNRQGPGSRSSTIRAFEAIPNNHRLKSILDVGCGKGQSSMVLLEISQADMAAVDNHQPFLDHLQARASAQGYGDRINVRNMTMCDLTFAHPSFDLIWSEGSAYLMGFKKALSEWKPLIRPGGYLFVSEAVWLTDQPSSAAADYFKIEYPGMSDLRTRKKEARELGYEVLSHFILPRQDWIDFYDDMEICVKQAMKKNGKTAAFEKMIHEIEVDRTYGEDYGYACLLLSPVP